MQAALRYRRESARDSGRNRIAFVRGLLMNRDFLRALTHELRNSIAPIVNAVHLIRLRGGKDPDLAGILSIIDRQIAGMTHTLDAVAEADRLSRGEIALQRQRIDIAAAVQSALQ